MKPIKWNQLLSDHRIYDDTSISTDNKNGIL